jgi:hypothetical protein
MTTHDFRNDSDQSERQRVERDTYLTRAQSDADLTSQGRFKKETATRVTGVPTYPSLPASSPWHSGFDENVEPPLGFAVDAMPAVENEIQTPTLNSPEARALPAAVEDQGVGEPDDTPPLVSSGSSIKRSW